MESSKDSCVVCPGNSCGLIWRHPPHWVAPDRHLTVAAAARTLASLAGARTSVNVNVLRHDWSLSKTSRPSYAENSWWEWSNRISVVRISRFTARL
ncbi:protein of unknown function [Paraburkholderia kururiensis]